MQYTVGSATKKVQILNKRTETTPYWFLGLLWAPYVLDMQEVDFLAYILSQFFILESAHLLVSRF